MKKIIAAIDGLKYSESTVKYAVHLAKQANAHLVGIFLDDFTYHSYKVYELIGSEGLMEERKEELDEMDKETRQHSVRNFENECRETGLNYSLHHDRSVAIQELLHESVFADLLIIDSRETLMHYEENTPTRFIRNLLSEVQCPVLVAPPEYRPINKIVMLYDGGPSSVYAIRQFSYVFPTLNHPDIEVLTVKSDNQTLHVPDNRLMKEFMKRHCPKATYTVLKGLPETEIVAHLKEQGRNILVVLGAYRRGTVSRWFRPSMADTLMEEIKAPLFIAHNK